ncbi:MAG: FecR domain-containing protein [Lachnospiraceae bacterium]|nr:FecR domain-containing protein [Lachnospiraceae bacterium]
MKKKGLIIGIVSAVAALAVIGGVVTAVVLKGKSNESYRVIKVQEVEGHSYVNRGDIKDLQTFDGMVLQSGDQVIVDGNSTLVLALDEDKFCYLEENTELKLTAEGTSANSKTKIELVKGALTVDVQNKLSDASSFDVTTPNSTMAIRGTVVRTEYYKNEKGEFISKYTLLEGQIVCVSVDSNGNVVETFELTQGEEILIGSLGNNSIREIDLEDLPYTALDIFDKVSDRLDKNGATYQDLKSLMEELEEKDYYTVTFMYGEDEFAVQEVKNGDKMVVPTLSPSSAGSWFGDINLPVDRDLTIYWR